MTYLLLYLAISVPCALRVAYLLDWPSREDGPAFNALMIVVLLVVAPFVWLTWPRRR